MELLAGLASLGRPEVAHLVADWRLAHPEPSEERLQELRDLARQLHADPDALSAPRTANAPSDAALPAGAVPTADPSVPEIKAGL